MPRRKGWKCNEEVRRNMSKGALQRQSRIIERYGLTVELYEDQIRKGRRWCSDCKMFKAGPDFGKSTTRCLVCQRIRNNDYHKRNAEDLNRKRRAYFVENRTSEIDKRRVRSLAGYGVTVAWYDSKVAEQNGVCEICKKPPTDKKFSIDHNHACCSTQKRACARCRRGLLCNKCNLALSAAEEAGWLENAAAYLRRYALSDPPDPNLLSNVDGEIRP